MAVIEESCVLTLSTSSVHEAANIVNEERRVQMKAAELYGGSADKVRGKRIWEDVTV